MKVRVESINCPKCGAPLDTTLEEGITICIHCGSRVMISIDREGQPVASIVKEVIDVVAEEALLRSLSKRKEKLIEEINQRKNDFNKLEKQIDQNTHERLVKETRTSLITNIGWLLLLIFGITFCLQLFGLNLLFDNMWLPGLVLGIILAIIGGIIDKKMNEPIIKSIYREAGLETQRLRKIIKEMERDVDRIDTQITKVRTSLDTLDRNLLKKRDNSG